MKKSNEDWKRILSPQQFHILFEKGTEQPFTGTYVHMKDKGMYVCAACNAPLFSSETKFDSGSGWPSFYDVAREGNVTLTNDDRFGMNRIEVSCRNCGGHLGHVFDDGPQDKTGKRYCINSAALQFQKKK